MNQDQTLNYYNENAKIFTESTVAIDFSAIQEKFLGKLPEGAYILDFGCGSGRDTKYFLERGYKVEATDGSKELCRIASAHTGTKVKQMYFQELQEFKKYDAIWACSSILHLNRNELAEVFGKIRNALKEEGLLYTSFKYGTFEGMRNGRYFTNLTEERLEVILKEVGGLRVEELWITGDARPGRGDERWLNVFARKQVKC